MSLFEAARGRWRKPGYFAAGGRRKMWVGAEPGVPLDSAYAGESRLATANRTDTTLGPLSILRTYSGASERPATWADHYGSYNGQSRWRPFWSTKAAPDDILSGALDNWLTNFVLSMPNDGLPVWATYRHEPENDRVDDSSSKPFITPDLWIPAYQRFYDIVKAARPDIQVGPCYLAYQWAAGRNVDATGGPLAWDVGDSRADYYGIDCYCMQGVPLMRLQDDPRFMRFHETWSDRDKPMIIVERGLQPYTPPDVARVGQMLLDDEDWCQTHNYDAFLYWQVKGGINELTGVSAAAFRTIASRGRFS